MHVSVNPSWVNNLIIISFLMTVRKTEKRDQGQGTFVFGFCIGMLRAKMLHVFQEWFLPSMSHVLLKKK